MEYFAGLDVSMEHTHIRVVDREGIVIHEASAWSSPAAIAAELSKVSACRRVVFDPSSTLAPCGSGLSY
jgi:hypothetical protein